jgi:hypothetical protein
MNNIIKIEVNKRIQYLSQKELGQQRLSGESGYVCYSWLRCINLTAPNLIFRIFDIIISTL